MLRQQVSSAQSDLESNIEALSRAAASGGDGTPLLSAQSQLQGLSRLQHRIATAHGGNLAAIRAEVLASIAATQVFVAQVRSAATAAQSAEAALHTASEAAHREVTAFVHDFYDRKIFDPYLRFSSPEDEEAYRKREAEHAEQIKAALAEGTPEGNLRATDLSIEQMQDAGRHGASSSADYQPTLTQLGDTRRQLADQLHARAQPTVARSDLPTPDPLDGAAVPADVSPDVLLGLRSVRLAESPVEGHGVHSSAASRSPTAGRTT